MCSAPISPTPRDAEDPCQMADLPAVSCFVIVNITGPNWEALLIMWCFVLYLLQLENYIVENMKSEMAQIQQNAVQNHTATMLEIGTSLLSQTAEQTRKLTDVETQVHPQGQSPQTQPGRFFFFSLLRKHRAHFSTVIRETYILFIGNNNNDCLTCYACFFWSNEGWYI